MTPKQITDQVNALKQETDRLNGVMYKLYDELYKVCQHENTKECILENTDLYKRGSKSITKIRVCRDCGVEFDKWKEITL